MIDIRIGHLPEHRQRLLVAGPAVTDRPLQALDCFDVVYDDIRLGVDDVLDKSLLALEVRDERLDENRRVGPLYLAYCLGEVSCPLVSRSH